MFVREPKEQLGKVIKTQPTKFLENIVSVAGFSDFFGCGNYIVGIRQHHDRDGR